MLKRIVALVLVVVSLTLSGCVSPVAGLKSYVDAIDGYEFLYPAGWLQTQVSSGADVVLHDLIEQTENISVVINPVAGRKTLRDLGDPGEVGYKLAKNTLAPADSGRQADLISAEAQQVGDKTYYLLEYAIKLPNQARHNLASVAVSRGKLYTFNVSTTEQRWSKVKDRFQKVVSSFAVY